MEGDSLAVDLRTVLLRYFRTCDGGKCNDDRRRKRKSAENAASIFAISASDCVVDGGDESFMREKRQKNQKYDGSMTVEASIVMSVVILSLASLIRYAYTVHDTVTGGMILEETIERVRNNVDKKKTPDMFEAEGTRMGNPRLFLGEYTIGLKTGITGITGDASAGDWHLSMERTDFQPATFLRKQDATKKIMDRLED